MLDYIVPMQVIDVVILQLVVSRGYSVPDWYNSWLVMELSHHPAGIRNAWRRWWRYAYLQLLW